MVAEREVEKPSEGIEWRRRKRVVHLDWRRREKGLQRRGAKRQVPCEDEKEKAQSRGKQEGSEQERNKRHGKGAGGK